MADETTPGAEARSLAGEVAVVTGALRGLGREVARVLAGQGAHVILAGRDGTRGRAAVAEIAEQVPGASVEFGLLDLADLGSARAFAERIIAGHPAVHLLVANAGIMAVPFARTVDGFELQFASNYLGHFLLVERLLPLLLAAPAGRVVTLSTSAPMLRPIRWADPQYETGDYNTFDAYGQSKGAAVLHAVELHRRFGDRGLRAVSVTPGVVLTELARHLTRDDLKELLSRMPRDPEQRRKLRPRTPAQGAEQIVWAATSDVAAAGSGGFCEDLAVHEVPEIVGGPDAAARLWTLSHDWVDTAPSGAQPRIPG